MNRRQRLMATLNGQPVDRPAVSFYEISGCEDMQDPDPFNIYSDPSWRPLIELARDRSDRIAMCEVPIQGMPPNPMWEGSTHQERIENGSRLVTSTIQAGKRTLTQRTRQDPDVNTIWTVEHYIKDPDDLRALLEIPEAPLGGTADPSQVLSLEAQVGDGGIVMPSIGDPLCSIAWMFDMAELTVAATTERELFGQLMERAARQMYWVMETAAKAVPGRLWRIIGPEYASPPYMRPELFREYVTPHVRQMVRYIHGTGGYARVHSHGRLRDILDDIVATGCMGLDPIEPPPQGDVELSYVRERYGKQLVLFGNLEIADIENLPTPQFEKKVRQAIAEGMSGEGRGFVLMPSACPYGRKLAPLSLRNYEKMIEIVEAL